MLSTKSTQVVKATLPVIGAAIGDITPVFYKRMFAAHPELERDLFNRGNQAQGDQQTALAGAIAAYATLLVADNGRDPLEVLTRIAHKHASLGIRPDQYQTVHDHLFWAIVDVLGDAVTPEVAAAWDEVYWRMAFALVNQERGLYTARGVRPETVWRPWRVAEKIPETDDVTTFVVERIDDRLVKSSLPGQYVTVNVPMPDGVRQPRQYSLTRADDGRHRQFSVKRVRGNGQPDGEVSNLLCDSVDVGDVVTMSLPFGDVVLDDSGHPVVFVSGGIGVTPMAGMVSHLVQAGSGLPLTLLHADLDERSFPLRRQIIDDLHALPDAKVHLWYERGAHSDLAVDGVHAGVMNLDDVDLPSDAGYYLCGPLPFMQAIRSALLDRGVAPKNIQYEVFGPDLWQGDLSGSPSLGAV
jgi:nitric oxide dioxygenase